MVEYMRVIQKGLDDEWSWTGNLPDALVSKLKNDIISCKNLIYNRDYGFDHVRVHGKDAGSILAMPYLALNTPAMGSEFIPQGCQALR